MKRDLQFAYAAGIIDGEGCLSIAHHSKLNTYYPRVQVNMTEPRPIRKLVGLFGGSVKVVERKESNWSTVYCYVASYKKAQRLIESVGPYLIEKQPHAQLLLELQNNIDEWNSKPRQRGNLPAAVTEYRRSLKQRVHELNQSAPGARNRHLGLNKREMLAYLTGVLEAEGCFSIQRGPGNAFASLVSVAMCCQEVVELFREAFGGTVVEVPPKHKARRLKFMWRVKGRLAANVCRAVMPYLTFKTEEAVLLLNVQNTTDLWAKRVGRGGMPEHITSKRVKWLERLHDLHRHARAETKSEQPAIALVSDSPIFTELTGEGPVFGKTLATAV